MESGFRRFLILALIVLLIFSGVSGFFAFQATGELRDAQDEIAALNGQISVANGTISNMRGQITGFNEDIQSIEGELAAASQQLSDLAQKAVAAQKAAAAVLPSLVYIETYSNFGVSSGSGVIMDSSGYILTNGHVVAGADSAIVITQDRVIYDVVDIWEDPLMDLAVVRIDAVGLPAAEFGETSGLQIGDTIIALGNPLGYSPADFGSTVTLGIVSNLLSYWVDNDYWYPDLIQFDVFITNGNSGGPLIDLNGNVIGINSLGEAPGINYAINTATAAGVYQNLSTIHESRHPYLGVDIWDYEKDLPGTSATQLIGAEVLDVISGSPADVAGLRVGDIVTSVNGQQVGLSVDLIRFLWRLEAGDTLTLEIDRGSTQLVMEITTTLRGADTEFFIY